MKPIFNMLNTITASLHNDVLVHEDQQLLDLLHNEYSQAYELWKKDIRLYKGIGDKNITSPHIITPVHRGKYLEAVTVLYTNILNILPQWAEYPNRQNSVMAINNKRDAELYGNVVYVLIKNNSEIGVCPRHDMWISFPRLGNVAKYPTLTAFIASFAYLACYALYSNKTNKKMDIIDIINTYDINDVISICDNIYLSNEYTNIKDELYSFEKILPKYAINNSSHIISVAVNIVDYIKQFNSTYKMLSWMLDPESNGFKLIETNEINILYDDNSDSHEVWYAAENLLVPITTKYNHILKYGEMYDE